LGFFPCSDLEHWWGRALGYGDEVLIKWVGIYGIGVFIEGGWKIGLVWIVCFVLRSGGC
jgi:hypothetical protein